MANYYVDLALGNDGNDGLGPYKAAFTSGGTYEIQAGDTVTDDTTAATAKVVLVVVSSGTWAGGDAAGTLYVGTPSGAFTASGTINVGANSNVATLTADFAITSKLTIASLTSLADGDFVRVKRMTAPSALGVNVTFTNGNAVLTLASALTQAIDDCESAWTQSANVTATADGSYEVQGTYAAKLVIASAFTTGKIAYFPLPSPLNLSSFQNVSLYVKPGVDTAAGVYKLCLCSDAAGDTIVDELTLPALSYDSSDQRYSWQKVLLKKGSALGSNINSIALYAISDPGSVTIYLDHIMACNDFSLDSAIGKNDGDWYGIRKIEGTSVTLLCSFTGASETVPGYHLFDWNYKAIPLSQNGTVIAAGDGGSSAGGQVTFIGGWNFSTDAQDFYTGVMAAGQLGKLFDAGLKSYITVDGFIFYQGYYGLYCDTQGIEAGNIIGIGQENQAIHIGEYTKRIFGTITVSPGISNNKTIISLGTSPVHGLRITADIRMLSMGTPSSYESGIYMGPGDVVNSGAVWCTGTITAFPLSPSYPVIGLLGIPYAFFKKITVSTGTVFSINNSGRIDVEEIDGSGGNISIVRNAGYAQAGLLRVARYNHTGGTETYSQLLIDVSWGWRSFCFCGRLSIDNFNNDPTAFIGIAGGGGFGDHVSLGYASDWGYGGTGKSLVLDPGIVDWATNYPVMYDFFIPADGSKTYKLSMQVKKSSSGANCTLSVTMCGCGMTMVEDESVSLTDSWAEFQSASFTTTYKGMIHVVLKCANGSTTGDVGIDAIKLVEVV